MRNPIVVVASLCAILGGASLLSATEMSDEGNCIWNQTASAECGPSVDYIAECATNAATECHDVNWKAHSATCTNGIISCVATWQP